MAQGTLSAANVVQATTGTADSTNTASVALDAGTQAGSTVIVELWAAGASMMDGGMTGRVPAGFEYDACGSTSANRVLQTFRKPNVAAGEGVAGSTAWDFAPGFPTNWGWRVTEWDTGLDPVFPLETTVGNFATGTSPTNLDSGTTTENGRAITVCLGWHLWQRSSVTAQSMTWSNHTGGFTERASLRQTYTAVEMGSSWSWRFNTTVGQYATTADINLASRDGGDVYVAQVVVYAATTYG
jgi:hypothetical protein